MRISNEPLVVHINNYSRPVCLTCRGVMDEPDDINTEFTLSVFNSPDDDGQQQTTFGISQFLERHGVQFQDGVLVINDPRLQLRDGINLLFISCKKMGAIMNIVTFVFIYTDGK